MTEDADLMERISRALNLPAAFRLRPDNVIADVPGWDSFGWVGVIAAIEEHSNREFPIERIDHVKTVGDLLVIAASMKSG